MTTATTTTTKRGARGWARRLSGSAAALALLGGALLTSGCETKNEIVMPGADAARGISVTGTGKVTVVPDVGEISMAAQVTRPSVQQARDDAAKAMDAIRAAIRAQGVEEKDVATSGFTIQPRYDVRPNGGTPQISGYQVSNQITVKVRKIEALSKVLDAAVGAGGNDVRGNSVQFTVDDPEKSAGAAREAAVANARTHAEALAKAAGVKLGKARSVAEAGTSMPVPRAVAASAPSLGGAANTSTPVSPGQTEVSATVSVALDIE